jgi:hypothetical protein
MKTTSYLRRRAELLEQIQAIGPVFRGSVVELPIRCGKANCRCQHGQPHRGWYASYREGGQTKVCYLPVPQAAEALELRRNWDRLKALLEQLAAVQVALWKETRHEPQAPRVRRRAAENPHPPSQRAAARDSAGPLADATVVTATGRETTRPGTRRAG